jgi:hypothetical protein
MVVCTYQIFFMLNEVISSPNACAVMAVHLPIIY